jgi:hypothetical protein
MDSVVVLQVCCCQYDVLTERPSSRLRSCYPLSRSRLRLICRDPLALTSLCALLTVVICKWSFLKVVLFCTMHSVRCDSFVGIFDFEFARSTRIHGRHHDSPAIWKRLVSDFEVCESTIAECILLLQLASGTVTTTWRILYGRRYSEALSRAQVPRDRTHKMLPVPGTFSST